MRNFLFDLDGTLTNPFLGITNSVIYALEKMGINPPPRSALRKFIGPPLISSFKKYYAMNESDAETAVKYYREYFSDKGLFENELFSGISALLSDLKKNGKKIYLATSKPEEFAVKILEHFDILKYFDFIAGNTLSEARQTKEEVISYLLDSQLLLRSESVMIGDRKFDILAGKEYSLKTVGVSFGFAEENELKNAGADYIADSVADLRKILLNIKK